MTDLMVLTRVLPAEALEDVSGLLSDEQAQKMAMYAADLERFQASADLAAVPSDAAGCHRVSDIEIDAKKSFAELERSRKARTEKLRDEVASINALYGHLTGPFEEVAKKASKLVLAWNQAERARVERERAEAQRKLEEAAQAEAAATRAKAEAEAAVREARARAEASLDAGVRRRAQEEAEAARKRAEAASAQEAEASRQIAAAQVATPEEAPRAYRSAAGTNSIVKRWVLAGFDPDKIPAGYWRHPDVLEAVRKVLAAQVKAGHLEIPGTVVEEAEGTRSR
jgi:DNA repair exonuclease SbcCD ATPase subunit